MKNALQLRLSQHLTLTPQLQQSIRLLQLSTLELNQEIERLRSFARAGLTEIALRIYANPADTIRLLGERVVPALAEFPG